jgi:UDP-N-acetyl-D-galactosamine dehydrogenase
MRWRQDFHVGYSPERINPGDKEHCFSKILKVVSGDDEDTLEKVAQLYASVVTAGVFRAASIRVAEAAKVIENTQRDINIAFVNELAIIFEKMGLDTIEVLKAAGTKWNFLPFRPGLVGGHCIGVDPYYLTHKAEALGYHPEVILAGRRINDGMGGHVARELMAEMSRRGTAPKGARVLVMGLAFKENCPDLRNTRVVDIIGPLAEQGARVEVWDPWIDAQEAKAEYGFDLIGEPAGGAYDAIVLAVAHKQFADLGAAAIRGFGRANAVLFDVKSILPREAADLRL